MDPQQQPSEDELRAQLEAEMSRVHVGDIIAQTIVSLINVGARRGGLAGAPEEELDLGQMALAIEGARRLFPLVEEALGEDANQFKEALSQLQMAFAQQAPTSAGGGASGEGAPTEEPKSADPRPNSGLWVPGQ